MIQTGDPNGTGKGGQSIWGNPFPDEIRSTLKVRSLLLFLHSLIAQKNNLIDNRPLAVQQPWDCRNGKLWPRHQ